MLNEEILPKEEMAQTSSSEVYQALHVTNNSNNNMTSQTYVAPIRKGVSIFKLQFALCDCHDLIIIFIAVLASLALGTNAMIFEYLLGKSINHLADVSMEIIKQDSINYLILAGVSIIVGYLYFSFWYLNGKRLTQKYRCEYFKLIAKQEQSWYDSTNPFELSARIESETKDIEAALGLKMGFSVMAIGAFISGLTICLLTNPKITGVVSVVCPILAISIYKLSRMSEQFNGLTEAEYASAGAIAEEAIYHIKTVFAYNNQNFIYRKYKEKMKSSFRTVIQKALLVASVYGLCEFLCHTTEAGSIFYFTYLVANDKENKIQIGDMIMIVDILIFQICMSLNEALPCLKILDTACFSARKFFDLKNRKSTMDFSTSLYKGENDLLYQNTSTLIPENSIEFFDVSFRYHNGNQILRHLTAKFLTNKINAIVGESGSGKSTMLSLLMRLYDVDLGEIKLNGINIKQYDYDYLKSQFGYVQQEPMLLNASIRDNILMGREGYTDQDIIEAARRTRAIKVINSKSENLDYVVGIKGTKLSGGEKQLIAITRAILAGPKFLILDEATSALDNKTEKAINDIIREISKSTTVILIAHRLSSIIDSDNILVLSEGKIAASGTHSELSSNCNEYKKLLLSMKKNDDDNDRGDDESEDSFSSESSREEEPSDVRRMTMHRRKGKQNLLEPIPDVMYNDLRMSVRTDSFSKSDIQEKIFSATELFMEGIHNTNIISKLKENPEPKKWLYSLMKNNRCLLVSIVLSSFLSGVLWPVAGFIISLFSQALTTQMNKENKEDFYKSYFNFGLTYSLGYFGIAVLIGVISFWKSYNNDKLGGYVSRKLRKVIFKKYLSMHCQFFDIKTNSPGALLSRLSFDAENVNNIIFSSLGVIVESLVTVGVAITIGCFYDFTTTLIMTAFTPLILVSMGFYFFIDEFESKEAQKIQEVTGEVLSEFITNIKTIKSFNYQDKMIDSYRSGIEKNSPFIRKKTFFIGIAYGISIMVNYLCYAATFFIGGWRIYHHKSLTFQEFIQILMPFYLSIYYLALAQTYVGDLSKANTSLKNLFEVYQQKSKTNINFDLPPPSEEANRIKGDIKFDNVTFFYSGNKRRRIISNLSLSIPYGKHIGIVGLSGSGKSTLIQLIERFFDANWGEISIDNKSIKDYNLLTLRSIFGYVQQEPPLFKSSIIDNIKFGNEEISDEDIISMMKEMNIDYLLTKGKAEQVSGGEKQRIALIRALLRRPKILLLDEATSSLDVNSESEVQKIIMKHMRGKTMLTVAHRLSTVVDCDEIIVMERGSIVERGRHEELMQKKGKYYELYLLNK